MLVRIITLSFLFLSSINFVFAQDIQFSDINDLPSARSAIYAATDGESIYVVNGFGLNEQFTSEVFKLNTSTNTWSALTDATIPKRFASAAIVHDQLYIFNGLSATGLRNDQLEVIDLNDGSISLSTINPQPVMAGGVAVWNDKIYSFGGSQDQGINSNKVFEFDPSTAIWTEIAEMPVSFQTDGAIVAGKLYVVGGYNGILSDRIYIYDISTNTWETELTMPLGISAHATTVIGTKIFIIGDFAYLNLVACFDTSDNSFNILNANLISRRHCATEAVNDQLYVIGGNTTSSIQSAISSVQVADFVSGIEKNIFLESFLTYPNPVTTNLHWDKDFDRFTISTLKGETIEVHNEKVRQINVENYAPGTYVLIGQIKDQFFISKWIKH